MSWEMRFVVLARFNTDDVPIMVCHTRADAERIAKRGRDPKRADEVLKLVAETVKTSQLEGVAAEGLQDVAVVPVPLVPVGTTETASCHA